MSLGLPAHLAPLALGRSFSGGLHAVAVTCLTASLLIVLVFQYGDFTTVLWPAALALVPMGVLLWFNDRARTAFSSASYLIVGGAGVYWFALTFYSQSPPIVVGDAFSLAGPKIALIMVGGSGTGLTMALTWTVAGYLVAEVAADLAIVQSGARPEFDVLSFLSVLALVLVLVLADIARRVARKAQPRLHRAARDEQLDALRYRIEVKAAALMHDTVLSHLAALAESKAGEMNPLLQEQMERDLQILIGEEWLSEALPTIDSKTKADWQNSGLYSAIQESRAMGLEVESTGDLAVVGRLSRESSIALGFAVKQCLVNVLRHAGTTHAEVAVYGSDTDVSVMVVDTGRGFSESETGADRLGLRTSVRRRIEAVHGSVQVWSTPGRGTSIMIRIPAEAAVSTRESA